MNVFVWQDNQKLYRLKQWLERTRLGHFIAFGLKQAWSCVFGGVLVAALILTSIVDLPWLSQYDWLFVIAVVTQIVMVATRLEQPREVIVIIVFHLVGLGMELYKTSSAIGSWNYPGDAHIRLLSVPLFSGFMYAAVGSYLARSWRVMHLEFSHYPNRLYTALLAVAIYVNFFTHHYTYDIRWLLFAAVIVLYWRTWVSYRVLNTTRRMPLIVGFGLIACVIWLAENVGTYTKVWLYPNQIETWELVGLGKIGSWFLLMIISFIMIELMRRWADRQDTKQA